MTQRHPGAVLSQQKPPDLTGREAEILQLVAEGDTNVEIGQKLGISIDTVKGHLTILRAKLWSRNRVSVVVTGLQLGLIHLDELPLAGSNTGPAGLPRLSGEETRVLAAMMEHRHAHTIAAHIGSTARVVLDAQTRIRRKWQAQSRAEIVLLGRRYLKALAEQKKP